MHMHEFTGRRFLFLLGSTRTGGNTEALALQAAAQLPSDVEQHWVRLAEMRLPAFTDLRHDGDGSYPAPVGQARTLLDATLDATDLVIASPLYWYSVSTPVKQYLDHWSGWMRVPGLDFRARMAGRTLWGVTALAGRDHGDADPLVGSLARTADHMRMDFRGVLLASATRPGQITADEDAALRAKTFFTP